MRPQFSGTRTILSDLGEAAKRRKSFQTSGADWCGTNFARHVKVWHSHFSLEAQ